MSLSKRLGRWRILSLLFLGLSPVAFMACQGGGEAPVEEVVGERVENPQHGVAIAALPSFFRLVSNDDAGIMLAPVDAAVAGSLQVKGGEAEIGGINLVAAIESHKEEVLAREGGDYKGQRELGSHLGTAFYSRGHYPGDGGVTVEETVVFLVHPWGDRTLQLIYVYPSADDSAARIQEQLLGVLGELEPMVDESAAGASADGDPAATDGESP